MKLTEAQKQAQIRMGQHLLNQAVLIKQAKRQPRGN
jgi:hypothetical protein